MTRRSLSPEEARAWARVAATVKPIAPRAADLEELSAALGSGETVLPETAPAKASRTRKPDAPNTQASAARALPAFLEGQQADGARCVLVITGKGREGEGVLRRNFLLWLDSPPARRLVSGYAESHPKHGGAGAFYVFLRRAD